MAFRSVQTMTDEAMGVWIDGCVNALVEMLHCYGLGHPDDIPRTALSNALTATYRAGKEAGEAEAVRLRAENAALSADKDRLMKAVADFTRDA